MINDFRKELDEREMISLIADLVNTPSYPGIPEQETGVAKLIHDFFVKEGIPSEIYEVVDGRCNVVARLEGHGKGKTLLLTGHTDTVPPYDMEDAFRMKIENEKLIGRGVVDMKGALACMVLSMAAIRRSGTRLKGNIMFAGVIGEEGKSEGTCALLKKGLKADAAIVGEPFGWNIGIGQKGLEWFECRILGKAVHGGKQKEGINAISKAGKLIRALDEELVPRIESRMHPIIGGSSMNYGMISGGFQPSTVAGECVLQFDRRWIPGEKYEDILREYDDFLERL
ncbi:MAG: M20 family metallopeptidase, partial [Synergistaceae bacterium]|nr:M20 family metallopeptidase [Synergistaceae bacterium]